VGLKRKLREECSNRDHGEGAPAMPGTPGCGAAGASCRGDGAASGGRAGRTTGASFAAPAARKSAAVFLMVRMCCMLAGRLVFLRRAAVRAPGAGRDADGHDKFAWPRQAPRGLGEIAGFS
jgi:hypothetical protein